MGGCCLVSHPDTYTCQRKHPCHALTTPLTTPSNGCIHSPRAAPTINTIRVINVSATRPVGRGGEEEREGGGGRGGGREGGGEGGREGGGEREGGREGGRERGRERGGEGRKGREGGGEGRRGREGGREGGEREGREGGREGGGREVRGNS